VATTDNGLTIVLVPVGTILFWCQWRHGLGLEAPPSHCREHFDGAHNGNKLELCTELEIDAVGTTLRLLQSAGC
jgi:hypothetical protein